MQLTVLGNLTIDEIVDKGSVHTAPGGSAYYVSRTAAYLGARVRLVSNIGRDYKEKTLRQLSSEGVDLRDVRTDTGHTTRFRLSYEQEVRELWLLERGRRLGPVRRVGRPDIIHLGPVFREVGAQHFKTSRARTKFLSADVQGLLRATGRQGHVKLVKRNLRPLVSMCDLVKASEEEASVATGCSDAISALRQLQGICAGFVLLTRGRRGLFIGVPPDVVYSVPRYPENHVVDPTGAGDTMVASWLHTYLTTRDPLWAACVGSAFASLILEKSGPRKFPVSRSELLKRSGFVYRRSRIVVQRVSSTTLRNRQVSHQLTRS